jgi:hypothetical protein
MHKAGIEPGEARQDVSLNINGVKPLIGDAITIKNHSVAGVKRKRGLGLRGNRDEKAEDKRCDANAILQG